jgi:hypothetical protein
VHVLKLGMGRFARWGLPFPAFWIAFGLFDSLVVGCPITRAAYNARSQNSMVSHAQLPES